MGGTGNDDVNFVDLTGIRSRQGGSGFKYYPLHPWIVGRCRFRSRCIQNNMTDQVWRSLGRIEIENGVPLRIFPCVFGLERRAKRRREQKCCTDDHARDFPNRNEI